MKDLVKETSSIVHELYEVAAKIEAEFPDEQWRTVAKLKNAGNDAVFYVAQVVGAGKSDSVIFDSSYARKSLYSLKSMYIFADSGGMTKLDPTIIVRIDAIIKTIDEEKAASEKELTRKNDEEMETWLKKYRIWQKISKDQK